MAGRNAQTDGWSGGPGGAGASPGNPAGEAEAASPWSRLSRLLLALLGLLALPSAALIVVTPLEPRAQAIFGAVVFAAALGANVFKGRTVTLALTLVALTVTTRYMFWRLTSTLPLDLSLDLLLGGALFLAELYSFTVMVLGYLQTAAPLRRKPLPLPSRTSSWPSVDVFIPTYHEPLEVVRATVLAAQAMDWPADKLRVCLLDDGDRPEFRAFARAAGVTCFARQNNEHAKAGNINTALRKTNGEYVAFFDCDHVPTRSFLQMTMGWFLADDKLAMVQTPHHFYSPDPVERNLGVFRRTPNEGELFYGLIQPGNDLWNATFFCGSCAVMRRSALQEVGGVAVETVTEDAHTALRMHRRGYTTAFIGIPLASGLATESLSGHVAQRVRWARGMAQILRLDNPLLGRGLTLPQRLCYLNSMLYFFSGLPRLVFLTAPLGFLLLDAHIFNAAPAIVLAYALPHLAHTYLNTSRVQGGYRFSFWGELYETLLSVYIVLPTTLAMINPRLGRFNVTAKGGVVERNRFDWRLASPFLLILGLYAVGLGYGLWRLSQGAVLLDALLINVGWAAYNIMLLSAAVAVAFERRQERRMPRVPVRLPAMLRLPTGHTVKATTCDLSTSGALLSGGSRDVSPGDEITLSLFLEGEELPLPATVARAGPGSLSLDFAELEVDAEQRLVRAVFSRADAWVRWAEGRAPDRPLLSLLGMVGQGLRGALRLVLAPTWRHQS